MPPNVFGRGPARQGDHPSLKLWVAAARNGMSPEALAKGDGGVSCFPPVAYSESRGCGHIRPAKTPTAVNPPAITKTPAGSSQCPIR